METENKSWLKYLVVGVIVVLIIIIIFLLIPKNKNTQVKDVDSVFNSNMSLFVTAGLEYFKDSKLPANIDSSTEITLRQMNEANLIANLNDENGNACNVDNSFIQVTKVLDNEYNLKAYLSCENKTDHINRTIETKAQTASMPSENLDNNTPDNDVYNKDGELIYHEENNYEEQQPVTNPTPNGSLASNVTNNNNNATTNNVTNNYYYNNCCEGKYCQGKCESNVYYTVTFDSQGGSYVAKQIVKAGDYATYYATSRSGYTFLGWYYNGSLYNFNTPVYQKITLVAKWQKQNSNTPSVPSTKYTVSFDTQGGSYIAPQTLNANSYASRPTNPTKECYIFVAWHVGSLNGRIYNFNEPVNSNLTLVAEWRKDSKCNKYTVSFDTQGGSNVNSQTLTSGSKATRPANPTKECYVFVAWHVGSLNGRIYNFNEAVTSNLTLVAEWRKDSKCDTYRVYFNANGGSPSGSQTLKSGERAVEPNNPTKTGYKFVGWYYNNQLFNFRTRIYQDYTLVAKWEKDIPQYTTTYCKVENERIYTTSYITNSDINNRSSFSYSFTLKYPKANITDLKITSYGNLSTHKEYVDAYNYWSNPNKTILYNNETTPNIHSSKYNTGYELSTYTLKANNIRPTISYVKSVNGLHYFNVRFDAYNLNNPVGVQKYYSSGSNWRYYTIAYFDIEYVNKNNCFNDVNGASHSGYVDIYK